MRHQVLARFSGLSIVSLILAIGLFGNASRAIAEDGCPDGEQPYQNNMTVLGCMPIPNYGNNNNAPVSPRPQPRLVAVPSYGAIAHDSTKFGSIGVSGSDKTFDSKKKAEKAALKMCRNNGGGDGCAIVVSVKDACTTLSVGLNTKAGHPVLFAIEFKPFDEEAKNKAAKVCTDNYEQCETKYFCAYNNITKTVRQ